MSRLPRIIVPGIHHHVTQRGSRRQRVFIEDDGYALYRDWLAQACRSNGVEAWSYCLMPNPDAKPWCQTRSTWFSSPLTRRACPALSARHSVDTAA